MKIDAQKIAADFEQVYNAAPPYESPGSTSYNEILKGAGVDCSGLFCAVYARHRMRIYHGSNTIAREYCSEREKLVKNAQLQIGSVVFKWANDGAEPQKYQGDGLGDFYHIGLVTNVSPLRIIHASSAKGRVWCDDSIKNWKYCGLLTDLIYDQQQEEKGGDYMYIVRVLPTSLRIREQPTTQSAVLGSLPCNTTIGCSALVNGWYKLSDMQGYISGDYVKVIKEIADEEKTDEAEKTDDTQDTDIEARLAALEKRVTALEESLS